MLYRKSDSCVVPMKSGNSDGGKATTYLSPFEGKHLLHAEVGLTNGNETDKDSRIVKDEYRNEIHVSCTSA